MTALDVLRNLLGRVQIARDAIADGDTFYAADVLADLEHDVAAALERLREPA